MQSEFTYRLNYLLVSLAIFAALVLFVTTYAEPVLRVSQMPDGSPPVMRRKLKPLTDYLEKKIGMKLEFRPMSSADALVDALLRHDLDLVWIDGFNLARARSRSNDRVIPLVQREEVEQTRSALAAAHGNNAYTWTVRADMDANLRKILTDAFLALDKNIGQDKAILELQRVGRFIPANVASYPVTASSR